mmetsp:Transcript_58627/g.85942  ORF Transcript_58627/g.85942 Transcript_58627/m.85942 type:complete len:478 (+) Transcript_58627:18-1451(+)
MIMARSMLVVLALLPRNDAFTVSPAVARVRASPSASFSARHPHVSAVLPRIRSARCDATLNLKMAGEVKVVGLIGATGGVGRLCAAALLEQGLSVRAIVRDTSKAKGLLPSTCEFVEADICKPNAGVGLAVAIKGVDALILCTGTTAFPSDKWGKDKKEYTPKKVDDEGIKKVVEAVLAVNAQEGVKVKRVTMLSSIGVKRRWQFPFAFLNLFGVLDAKAAGEEAVIAASVEGKYDYAIVRPGRLVGGPYTGTPDVASLLKMDEGALQGIEMRNGDPKGFSGDASRRQTALAMAQTVMGDKGNVEFCFVNKKGPPLSQTEWDTAFDGLGKGSAEALRLEFTTLNKEKFRSWLVNWGGGIVTSGALFPPLPIPFRIDYPKDPETIGLQLSFLEVSVTGEVQEVGQLIMRLEDGKKGPVLSVMREPAAAGIRGWGVWSRDEPFPGETQILEKMQDDLFRVTTNSRDGAASWAGANNIDV